MNLAQQIALKAHVIANTTVLSFGAGNATISATFQATPLGAGDANLIAVWYNLQASPDFFIWRDLPMQTLLGLITFANMTPQDVVPASNALDALLIWQARSLACQGKQLNLQNMIIGRQSAPMKNQSYRAALNDCLTALPSGALGVDKAAGWTAVRDAAKFFALNVEKALATGAGTFASPADAAFEGTINGNDVSELLSV